MIFAFLFVVGVVGGVATSAGAIATVLSYPALLAVGVPPLAANVSNAVAVVASGVGAALGSRPELRGTAVVLRRRLPPICIGALGGAVLLLSTPSEVFVWVVPFLVAAASVLMLVQPRIARRSSDRRSGRSALPGGLLAVGVYDGYFGAASGIMALALLLITVEPRLTMANAQKNVLLGVADGLAAIVFIAFGPLDWSATVPLALGFLAGGALGPAVARRMPEGALRVVIAIAGFGLAIVLLVSAA